MKPGLLSPSLANCNVWCGPDTAAISIRDSNGVTQGGANGFPIIVDTGSSNVLVQGFNQNGQTVGICSRWQHVDALAACATHTLTD